MAKKSETLNRNDYVKKQTLTVAVIVAVVVGFFGGVTFTIFKSGPSAPAPVAGNAGPAAQQPQPNPEVAAQRALNILDLEKKTSQNPGDVNAWIELGNLYFDTDNYDKAITAYNEALGIDPNNANVITDLGVMYRRSGQPEEAVKAFERAIQTDPKHEIARFNKGIVLMHDLNDIDGAIAAWEGLVAVNPLAVSPSGQSVDQIIEQLKQKK